MQDDRKRGWHPLVMACPDCDGPGDPECENCGGTGMFGKDHTVHDGLFMDGGCVAKVEAFYDDGPWYANAITPAGTMVRGGAKRSHSAAAEWCERISGYAPAPDPARPGTDGEVGPTGPEPASGVEGVSRWTK